MLEAFDFVIFGGAGDLALRKLVPAFYRAHRAGELPDGARIITTCRNTQMVVEYKDKVREAAQKHLRKGEFVDADWDKFAERIYPVFLDIAQKAKTGTSWASCSPAAAIARECFISPLRLLCSASAANTSLKPA